MTTIFGERWDAPATEGATAVPTPVGSICIDCDEVIKEGDQGFIRPVFVTTGPTTHLVPVHRECQLLSVSGHHFGYCRCTNYKGLTRRNAALALWHDSGLWIRDNTP